MDAVNIPDPEIFARQIYRAVLRLPIVKQAQVIGYVDALTSVPLTSDASFPELSIEDRQVMDDADRKIFKEIQASGESGIDLASLLQSLNLHPNTPIADAV